MKKRIYAFSTRKLARKPPLLLHLVPAYYAATNLVQLIKSFLRQHDVGPAMRWRHPSGKGAEFVARAHSARLEDMLHRFGLSPILRQIGCCLNGILDLAIAERKTFGKRVNRYGLRVQVARA
jgi:hypothetical protein